jgi:hypothetical protein
VQVDGRRLWAHGMIRDDPCRLVRQVKQIPLLELITND